MASPPDLSTFFASNPEIDSTFEQDSIKIQTRLSAAKDFAKLESKRLSGMAKSLQDENAMLKGNLDNSESTALKPEICDTLGQAPIKCLPMPSPTFFDNLIPILAEFVETYDTEKHDEPKFLSIWTDFSRMQAQENGLMQSGQFIQKLALENYCLREQNVKSVSGEQSIKFGAVLGEPAHPDMFLRNVPHYVSSSEETPKLDVLTSISEFQKMTGHRDLVLEEGVLSMIGCTAMAYHPLSTVYFPAFPGQGIPSTARSVKVADPVTFFDLDNFFCLETMTGAKFWVKKNGNRGVWVFP